MTIKLERGLFLMLLLAGGCTSGKAPDIAHEDMNVRVLGCSAATGTSEFQESALDWFTEGRMAGAGQETAIRLSSSAIFLRLEKEQWLETYEKYLECFPVSPKANVMQSLSANQLNTTDSRVQFAKNVCMGEDVNLRAALDHLASIGREYGSIADPALGYSEYIPNAETNEQKIFNVYVDCVRTVYGVVNI